MSVVRDQHVFLATARQIASEPRANNAAFAAAVIIAQTACEIATLRAIEALIDARGLRSIGDAIKSYQKWTNYSLA